MQRYYETTFEEHVQAVNRSNLHPELTTYFEDFPKNVRDLRNVLFYGPPGVGKYSQALTMIKKYSPSGLKYDKRIGFGDKIEKKKTKKSSDYTIRASDIHFEVDMSTLGCNSKNIWHDLFFQIIEIVSSRPEKTGIILCKNFHLIYNELLDVFHSYIRHPLQHYNIHVVFILLSEHMSFVPEKIISGCFVIPVARPSKDLYLKMKDTPTYFLGTPAIQSPDLEKVINEIDLSSLVNAKEIHLLKRIHETSELPKTITDIILSNIIERILQPDTLQITEFRNHLYDLLIYQVDIPDAICTLFYYFIEKQMFPSRENISAVSRQMFIFFQYFNNNYRSIYHLESILFFIMNHLTPKTKMKIDPPKE